MANIRLNVAFAIMLAILNFSSTEAPILVDYYDAAANRLHHVRLDPQSDGYSIISTDRGERTIVGGVAYDPARPAVFNFGEPGVTPPLDLAEMLPEFADLGDPSEADVAFRAELDEESVNLRQIRSGGILFLMDRDADGVFVIHPAD